MFNRLKTLLFGSVSVASLAQSGALDRLAPPPGGGWRVSPEPDHAGRWTLWSPEGLATGSFPTREGAERYAGTANIASRQLNAAPPQEYAVDDLEAARVERRTAKAPELAAPYDAMAARIVQGDLPPTVSELEAQGVEWRTGVFGFRVEGPREDGNFWVVEERKHQRPRDVKGYTRRRNAQAAADKLNNAEA